MWCRAPARVTEPVWGNPVEDIMRQARFITALALVACGNEPEDTDNGDRIDLIVASFCEETSRETLTDLSATPEGFTSSPEAAIAALAGGFVGKLTTYDALGAEASQVDVSADFAVTSVQAVRSTRVTFDVDGAEVDTGEACAGVYELAGTAEVSTADGGLDESFPLAMRVDAGSYGVFSVDIDLADVGGTARPTSFDPADWDATALHLEGSGDTGAWVGSAWWMASNEYEEGGDTGEIEPSGTSETVGTFALGRP